jgi:hypothetical protein
MIFYLFLSILECVQGEVAIVGGTRICNTRNGGMDFDDACNPRRASIESHAYDDRISVVMNSQQSPMDDGNMECQRSGDEHPSSGIRSHPGRGRVSTTKPSSCRSRILTAAANRTTSPVLYPTQPNCQPNCQTSPACSATASAPSTAARSHPTSTPSTQRQRPQTTKRHRGWGEQESVKGSALLLEIICQLRQSALSPDTRVALCTQFLQLCLLVSTK